MSRKKFEKLVTDLPKDHNKKARCAEEYLNTEVFDEDRWGGFLRSLRDRVAHHDRIRAGRQSSEQVLDKSLDWPTIQEATFHRRAQEFENHAWEMLTTVIPSLWDREWIVGPYREGMWDTV